MPDYKIIIEVYGEFWHSREGQWERDAMRFALYTAMGFDVRVIYAEDIITNPEFALLAAVPELVNPTAHGSEFRHPPRYNPVAAIQARLRKYPRVVRTRSRMAPVGPRTRPTGRRPREERPVVGPSFRGATSLTTEYVQSVKDWGNEYRDWFFGAFREWVAAVTAAEGQAIDYAWIGDPDFVGYEGYGYWMPIRFKLTQEQKDQISFYFKWHNWWKRYGL